MKLLLKINSTFFLNSGNGLFAKKDFAKGDFVIEYSGELLCQDTKDEKKEAYIFEFTHCGKRY